MSCASQFLATPAVQLQCGRVGEGAGRGQGDGTTVCSSLLWPPGSDTSAGEEQS